MARKPVFGADGKPMFGATGKPLICEPENNCCCDIVADFSATQTSSDTSEIEFTDLSTTGCAGGIVSWFWEFGDGGTSTSQNPTHTYTGSGDYAARLTVTDDCGCEATKEILFVSCCSGSVPPVNAIVTFTGSFTDGSCTNCDDVSGTWVVPYTGLFFFAGQNYCRWVLSTSEDCAGSPNVLQVDILWGCTDKFITLNATTQRAGFGLVSNWTAGSSTGVAVNPLLYDVDYVFFKSSSTGSGTACTNHNGITGVTIRFT